MLRKLRVATMAVGTVFGGIIYLAPLVLAENEVAPTTQSATAKSAVPATLTVLGKQLDLKDSKGKPGSTFIAEYIPKNETWDNWTEMFATRFIPGSAPDAKGSAEATAKRIFARREKGDYVANAAVYEAPDHKSFVVDFLISEGKIFEHNVFRYFAAPNGLVSLQIARRAYDNDSNEQEIQDFIKSIQTQRESILKEITRPDLPVADKAK